VHTPRPHQPRNERNAGILLHPTSLPGPFGVGDFGPRAYAFLDWLQSAGQKLWQLLPLNPPGYGNSPYGCLSSFAGNPLLISPEQLAADGLLPDGIEVPQLPDGEVDFDAAVAWKESLLRRSFEHFEKHAPAPLQSELEQFVESAVNAEWLDDWALFMTLKSVYHFRDWPSWDADLALREPAALEEARNQFYGEIRYHEYVQWLFFRQWDALRGAAHARGIRIVGDVPVYAAHDSADAWSHRELFHLDAAGKPTVVAGVPPDYFSADGQRWGNPLYRWDVMAADSYAWWISRVRANLRMVDILRLDHFRAFAAYWEIAASEPTAKNGRWVAGPGRALFDALRTALGDLPLVAEDLGFITKDVDELRIGAGLPGMKILQFAFDDADSPHLPHRYECNTVVYTGTHDNDTARGWYEKASEEARAAARTYLGCAGEEIARGMIHAAYTSVANTAIVPLQDVLGAGSEARMNRPGEGKGNWAWRFRDGALTPSAAAELKELARVTGR
jgi:4-alpha-glucanotransferase